MNILFYTVTDENNKLTKTLGTSTTFSGSFRASTDVVNPEFNIQATNPTNFNYVYISNFKRYYFITDIVNIGLDLWTIRCHVDVLMSYNAAIKNLNCIMERQENKYNLYMQDNELTRLGFPLIQTKVFPNSISAASYNFFLTVAGGV